MAKRNPWLYRELNPGRPVTVLTELPDLCYYTAYQIIFHSVSLPYTTLKSSFNMIYIQIMGKTEKENTITHSLSLSLSRWICTGNNFLAIRISGRTRNPQPLSENGTRYSYTPQKHIALQANFHLKLTRCRAMWHFKSANLNALHTLRLIRRERKGGL
jgi:hypothetical protein